MNKGKKFLQVLLLLIAFIVVFMLGGLIVLKIKEDEVKQPVTPDVKIEESNYIEKFDLTEMLTSYKNISYNSHTELDGIKMYGLESLNINKISVENGRLKYYTKDLEYTDNNLYGVKYIEMASDDKTYTELLVYTNNGVYYYNTNGESEIIDEEARKEYFKETNEKAIYYKNENTLNLNFIKVYNSYNITGITTKIKEDKSYFVIKTYSDVYTLDYNKATKHGINMVTQVSIGNKLLVPSTKIGEIGKDNKLIVNYDLSLKNNEVLKYQDETIKIYYAYLTKDAYYFVDENNNIYTLKLIDFNTNSINKYNKKDVEKVSYEEEKTYQGEVITSVKQYLKVLYKDGTNEEIL